MNLDFPGSIDTLLLNPGYIARDSNSGALYVVTDDRVVRWLPNNKTGTIVAGGNGHGTTSTQLYSPSGLYFDSLSNSLYISDSYANIIVRWTLGASNWTLVAGILTGMCEYPPRGLCMPSALTSDPMGNLYVADGNGGRILLFLAGSNSGTVIAMPRFSYGIALDNELNLYASEQYTHQVIKFARL